MVCGILNSNIRWLSIVHEVSGDGLGYSKTVVVNPHESAFKKGRETFRKVLYIPFRGITLTSPHNMINFLTFFHDSKDLEVRWPGKRPSSIPFGTSRKRVNYKDEEQRRSQKRDLSSSTQEDCTRK